MIRRRRLNENAGASLQVPLNKEEWHIKPFWESKYNDMLPGAAIATAKAGTIKVTCEAGEMRQTSGYHLYITLFDQASEIGVSCDMKLPGYDFGFARIAQMILNQVSEVLDTGTFFDEPDFANRVADVLRPFGKTTIF